ncbi:zinc-binding dehydrogenase [Jeotgalicoccus psychrophilus]|uniref:zinc-binding dehydrogenase n=1 Tax=Jeotgalicoccus psychrophilus TaxID=157228 RepID=UPI0024813B85|nr:zinc-binding dehydrogenase [Jeotgalicoccus psychrophilus]
MAVDNNDMRLAHAKQTNNVEVYNYKQFDNLGKHIHEITKGGAEVVIDCVGMDGEITSKDRIKTLGGQVGTIDPIIMATDMVKKFRTIQLTGIYGTPATGYPIHKIFTRNVTVKAGQAPVIHYMPELYNMVEQGKINPTDIITHQVPLKQAEKMYKMFNDRADGCIKVVMKP